MSVLIKKAETGSEDSGRLQVNIVNEDNAPVEGAQVDISVEEAPDNTIDRILTDVSGQTETVDLSAPPLGLSLDVNNTIRPYSEYTLNISAPGYESVEITGVEILPDSLAIQNVRLEARRPDEERENIVIPEHTLYGEYPPKIAEAEIKPTNETGEIVLSRVVVPEYVVVHNGTPSSSATDYYVLYKDYIKNVASSEIYATWPEATITANVLAIMSFTMNRVYTEWYRNRGYDFTITSSTAYDQKWIYGRNIFESISLIVDAIFDQFLSRPNVRQPILTQYCDGKRVTCPNWLSQWGSCELGERGYSASEIIRYYYGEDMYINTAEQISGIPASWPGYNLDIGASGQKVMQLQEQLNRIAQVYSAIPQVAEDGIYGENTKAAVRTFQRIFDLPQTGITDFSTWYMVSQIYVGVTRIAEGISRG